MRTLFKGTGVALITPFLADGKVDYASLEQLIEHCISGGIDFLVSLGTTGETATLSEKEQSEVLDFTIQTNRYRLPIVVGIGGNDTKKLVTQVQNQNFDGIDAILSVSPYYNKPTQEGIFQHYMAIAEVAPRPIIIYNVPARTGSNIAAQTTLRLAASSEKFVAIKEASGDIRQAMEIIQHAPEGFSLLSGDDNMTLPLMACGATGVISVIGQGLPRVFSDMVNAANQGDFGKARTLHYKLAELTDLIFAQGNPAGIKTILNTLGICNDYLRLPLVQVDSDLRQKISQKMAEI
jgi:4-hydroxy-tetrahydrodipicolinate synthase